MCSFLIEFMDIENTKYILSNLIANKKQMDEEVIYSTAGQTILWATKGDEIKHEKFYFFFSFSFSFPAASIDHITVRITSTFDQRIFIYFTWLLKTIKALESNCSDTYKILFYCTLHASQMMAYL